MTTRYKYPRTPHLPWSPNVTDDDRMLKDVNHFEGKNIVVSIKMDGENTTMYRDDIHARSMDSPDHESRHYVKGMWSNIRWMIPDGWRICGENLYAKHSIYYKHLPSYFMVFSIWNDKNRCVGHELTLEICEDLGLIHVPIILETKWRGYLEMKDELGRLFYFHCSPDNNEGYVVRVREGFDYEEFDKNVAKYVRENHVQTDEHWMYSKLIPNELEE